MEGQHRQQEGALVPVRHGARSQARGFGDPIRAPQFAGQSQQRTNLTIQPDDRDDLRATTRPRRHSIRGSSSERRCIWANSAPTMPGGCVFLGGYGAAGSPFAGYTLVTYGNNPGWYDDTRTGRWPPPSRSAGGKIPCDEAWVVTAPPDFAPDIIGVVTMYDLIYDALAGTIIPDARQAQLHPGYSADLPAPRQPAVGQCRLLRAVRIPGPE